MHNVPLYKKYGINKKYYSSVSSADFTHLESPQNIFDRVDSASELHKHADFHKFDSSIQTQLLTWSKNGYVILEKFLSDETVDAINEEIDRLVKERKVEFKYGKKIMFAMHISKLIRDIGADERLMTILNLLMGKEVELFQSINFVEGSEQKTHSDSFHMTTYPYGNLIAVWIALEDITADSGPLHYYPGSHKLPYVMNADFGNESSGLMLGNKEYSDYTSKIEEVIATNELEKEVFLAKKGDLLIWHANLLHGGEPMSNPNSSRKSVVYHYYTNDAICYHEITERPTLK